MSSLMMVLRVCSKLQRHVIVTVGIALSIAVPCDALGRHDIGSLRPCSFGGPDNVHRILRLEPPDRELYVQMLVHPPFEPEFAVSLYLPKLQNDVVLIVSEASARIPNRKGSGNEIGVEEHKVEIDIKLADSIRDAFAKYVLQARFSDDPEVTLDLPIYEFYVMLFGSGLVCAELDAPRDEAIARQFHPLIALGYAMIEYTKEGGAKSEDLNRILHSILKRK